MNQMRRVTCLVNLTNRFLSESGLFTTAGSAVTAPKVCSRNYGDNAVYVAVKDATASGLLVPKDNDKEVLEFSKLLPDIVRDLTELPIHKYETEDANKYLAKVLQYNMTIGDVGTGVSLVESYKILTNRSEANLKKVRILGWCLEMLQASLLITQDMIDGTQMRRGKPCWYLKVRGKYDTAPKLLEASVYKLLKQHFSDEPCYTMILEQFHAANSRAVMGQALDIDTRFDNNLQKFTMDRYNIITKYKTSYFTFKLPVTLAMIMAGIKDPEVYRQARTILFEMGQFYQAQMDFKNCYGSSNPYTAPGTDIQDGKCTWLAVVALQRVSQSQKKVLVECYGEKDDMKAKVVKEIYSQIGLRSTFQQYQDHSCQILCTQIQQVSRGLTHRLFFKFLKGMSGFTA